MSLVEKEVTQNNVEQFKNRAEFQQRQETERKLMPVNPELFENYRATATPIEQVYLSKPGEEFSLRVRSAYTTEGVQYTATLKDRGELVNGAVQRLEVETPISQEAYEFYAAQHERFPVMKQLRSPIAPGMSIDFIEGLEHPIIEVDTNDAVEREVLLASFEGLAVDQTGNPELYKEHIAHSLAGTEKDLYTPEALEALGERVAKDMIAQYVAGRNQVVAGLTGMSGSGKTTVTRAIQSQLTELLGDDYAPIVVSTDDYHRGKKWLEETYGAPWTAWDDPRVYNTAELAADLKALASGESLIKRHFDFEKEETVFDEEVQPSPFVIVEGLYAASKDLDDVRDLHYELPTGIATSIGRDVRRLIIEDRANRAFPTPEARLQYQIESALPVHLEQRRQLRNGFNASARPMAQRAFMLHL